MPAILQPRLLQLPTKILGKQCVLRPYRSGDGRAKFEAVNEDLAELSYWMPWPERHRSVEDSENYAREMAGKWITRDALILGVFSLDEKTLLGGCGFHGFDWTVPSLEIGWYLRKSARGQGIATEAVSLCCTLAFDHMKVNRVWGSCDALNTRSAKLFERIGFAREAHLRGERRDHRGNVRDSFVYGMLARDWASQRDAT
ncbi:MAG: N-acetyltransferase [Betaproteobacteria bacterium]|nr:MAG: N-acetyltransferase [Betaproteobacteria bacterium]